MFNVYPIDFTFLGTTVLVCLVNRILGNIQQSSPQIEQFTTVTFVRLILNKVVNKMRRLTFISLMSGDRYERVRNMDIKTFREQLGQLADLVYEKSVETADEGFFAIVKKSTEKRLAVSGQAADRFSGEMFGAVKLCPLSVTNGASLYQIFPYTKPRSRKDHSFTFGMGDRLGLATPGHIEAIKGYDVFPIFAQQSIRELTLTRRSFPEVIAAAAFSVFQEGFKSGYGADGDHLKTLDEIDYALESGCTMVTLDCSEQIDNDIAHLGKAELSTAYNALPGEVRSRYESLYLDQKLPVIESIDSEALSRIVLTFYRAIDHAVESFRHMTSINPDVDFEMSIDETPGSTSPAEHFVIGNELCRNGVKVSSMAPHFSGSFEKGIDYVGDLEQLEEELTVHQRIAEHFNYRLSLHSGSDKFTVFPLFGRITAGHAHMKIAGTNWLEAVRVVAEADPQLFRKTLDFAILNRGEAERYYHISTSVDDIIPLDQRSDAELTAYLNEDAARQTLHITYGLLLNEDWFRQSFFELLNTHEDLYQANLADYIGKHLASLNRLSAG